ncbi:MAG TPA: hypothetical protein VHY18_14565 [Solirubrobacteraceae bacterium]|nr:hypothetical protein [Solirubrobacteraceae bacterium]
MRSLQLQAALAEFIAQAADSLHADVAAGQEVPFELASQSGRGRGAASLYCYRPLTGEFIAERFPALRRLDAYAQAAGLLDGFEALDRYLIASGADPGRGGRGRGRRGDGHGRDRGGDRDRDRDAPSRGRADTALLLLLQEVFDQQTDFDRSKMSQYEQRLEQALERLEDSTFAAAGEVTLVATLHGLTIGSPELALARGLLIAHPDALQGAPDQAQAGARGEDDHLLVVFSAQASDPRAAIAQGKDVLRELLRALRLFGDGRIALGALAWARTGSAPWAPFALGSGGRPHGMLVVGAGQEDELRAFCNLVSRRAPHDNEIAWALRRFELGCERPSEYEAISDHLLALRALLGASSELVPAGMPDGLLAGRLAALCATPEQRAVLAQRTLKAIALERQVISGTAKERTSAIDLARELSDHLRALLRDVVCGHLPADLGSLADELLLGDAEAEGNAGKADEVGEVGILEEAGEVGEVGSRAGEEAAEQLLPAVAATPSERHAGRITGSSGKQAPGDDVQASEVLHVAV